MNGGNVIFKFSGDDNGLKNALKGVNSSFGSTTKSILTATGITKAFSVAMDMVKTSTGDAVKRLDALNQFPRVMSNLNVSAEESQKAIDKMSKKLQGLPTTLDEGAMAVQRFTSKNGDVAKSTDLFLALNNAILAGGASAEIQSSALEQMSQAYAKGKPDMMEWRTMMTAMPAQLKQVATAMGMVDADALGEALREGIVSMDDFMETIQTLNTEGVGGFKSFEEQAKNATGGVATSIKVMKTRVAQGVANILKSLDKALEKYGGLSGVFVSVGDTIKSVLNDITPFITGIVTFLVENLPTIIDVLKTVAPVLAVIVAAIEAYNVTVSIAKTVTKGWEIAQKLLNGTIALNPIGLLIASIVALIAIGVVLWNKCEWFRDALTGLFEAIKVIIDIVFQKIKDVVNGVISIIGGIIDVGASIVDWFKEIPGKVKEIGLNIVKGIGKGITSGYDWIKKRIKEWVGNVVAFLKKVFHIGSPSKLMEEEIGKFLPQGVAVGIEANTSSVYDAMKDMQKGISKNFGLSPELIGTSSLHYSPNVVVENNITSRTDSLGQTVTNIKTFANGAKNDYNYGMGV